MMYEIAYYGNDGCVRYLGDTYLAHYNHNHDKLGRFAKSNGSRMAYSYALNRMDNRHVKLRGKEMKATISSERTAKKLSKISKSNRPASYEKTKTKLNKQKKKIDSYKKEQKDIEKQINKTISDATKKGYTVKSIQTSESSQSGKDIVTMYLAVRTGAVIAGPVGAAGGYLAKNAIQNKLYESRYENRFGGQNPSNIQGNTFRVRNTKKGSKPKVSYESRYRTDRNIKSKIIGDRVQTHSLYGNEQITREEYERNRIIKEKKKKR